MKPTLTIGIFAYNEEASIGQLLVALVAQKGDFDLQKIIVASDGSSDSTVDKANSIQDKRIFVINDGVRMGKTKRMNQIHEMIDSDILVGLDADVRISSDDFINNLVAPLKGVSKPAVVFGLAKPSDPKGFIQKALYHGSSIWNEVIESVPNADMYHSEGRVRALNRAYYTVLRFPHKSSEDIVPFLYAKQHGFEVFFAPKAKVIYTLPSSYRDYMKQTLRFFGAKKVQESNFGADFIKDFYVINSKHKSIVLIKNLFKHPVWTPTYLILWSVPRLASRFLSKKYATPLWRVAGSTKRIGEKASNSKPHIFFSTYDDLRNPYYGGGGATAIHEVACRLANDFEVTVLTGNYPGAQNLVKDNVEYKRAGLSFVGPFLGQIFFHFSVMIYAATKKYDVWVESFTPPFSTSLSPLVTSKPVIGLVHMLGGKNMSRKYHLPFEVVENLGMKAYSKVIVLTDFDAQRILSKNPSAKVEIIGNGVMLPDLANNPFFAAGKSLSFIGRIDIDQKGLDFLLQAYYEVRKRFDIPLVIAGAGSESSTRKLSAMIQERGLSQDVTVLGSVNGKEKEAFFKNTLIGICPSRYESYSLVALEMMSYGIPLIGFDIPGLAWADADKAIKVPAFDVQALTNATIDLLSDENKRTKLAYNAREFASKNNWDVSARKYAQFISQSL